MKISIYNKLIASEIKKNLLLVIFFVFILIFVASIFVFAGTIIPTVSNTNTGSLYTLNDIYNFVKNNTVPSTHNVTTSFSPTATTSVSVSQLYTALVNLIDPQYVVTGTSLLGVIGDFGSTTSHTNNLTASSSYLSPYSLTPQTYSLEDVWNLIHNSTTNPSVHTTTSDSPSSVTTHSLGDIYTALSNLFVGHEGDIAHGKSYLGVNGMAVKILPIAHYKMNDTDGFTAIDSSGNGNNGSGSYTPVGGKIGGGFDFPYQGQGDETNYITTPTLNLTSNFSIAFWVKLDDGSLSQPSLGFIGNSDVGIDGQSGKDILIDYYGVLRFIFENAIAVTDTLPLEEGKWTYFVITYNDQGYAKIFRDGQLVASSSGGPTDNYYYPLNIGFRYGSRTAGSEMDDVRIYNRALSSSEVSILYNESHGIESEPSFFGLYITPPPPPPGIPSNVSATPGNGMVTISFTAPGGSPISYIVKYRDESSLSLESTVTTTNTSINITGLNDGDQYSFSVSAKNTGGKSAYSDVIYSTPISVPSAPQNVVATAGYGSANITFSDDDIDIDHYTIISNPDSISTTADNTYGSSGLPVTISGLTPGTSYTFTVTATNLSNMTGPGTVSNAVVPLVLEL